MSRRAYDLDQHPRGQGTHSTAGGQVELKLQPLIIGSPDRSASVTGRGTKVPDSVGNIEIVDSDHWQ